MRVKHLRVSDKMFNPVILMHQRSHSAPTFRLFVLVASVEAITATFLMVPMPPLLVLLVGVAHGTACQQL